ncbi:hypothetical protein K525DRAFT_211769 [Schizophyllum commune Loenen D]|nr:hypothetical protein K525DRAFT_211769 [Schizophyllum commune Loenen D]
MCFGKTADILTRELSRTKCRPLDVEIETIDSRSPAIQEAWDVLRQEGHRWRTLILYYPFTIGGVPNSVACPALQTLDVTTHLTRWESVDGDNPPFGEALLFGYLSDAPSLRRVTLTLMRIDEPAQIRFPDSWKLSHLTLDVDCCDDPLHLLRNVIEQAAATSEALKIEVQESNGIPRPVHLPTFHFAVLQELQLHELAYCFIVFIDAPVLASLCIKMTGVTSFEDDNTWDTLDYPPIPEVLRKVAGYTVLTKLELDGIALREASTLLATLQGLPNIEWLRLAEPYAYEGKLISNALLAGLTRGGVSVDGVDTPRSALCPLPNLTELFVHLGKHDAADVSSLAVSLRRLALSRHPSVPHLEDDEGNSLRSLDAFQATYGLRWSYFAADVVPSWGERFEVSIPCKRCR